MAEDVHPLVLHRPQEAVRHLLPPQPEVGVHGGDDEVEVLQEVAGDIHRPVAGDVRLDAREERQASCLVPAAHLLDLAAEVVGG